ncbi:MAG TPA: tetratricopeptide repeat protein [Burkholderiales bacterium]|nr:tetratricopeptide repeat protein [Burkholderiales bacterium]
MTTTPGDDSPALRAGLALLRNNQASSAEAVLETAARDSDEALAWHYLGVARHALQKRAGAIEAFRRAIERGARSADPFAALAVALGQEGRWCEAESVLLDGLARLPDDAGLHFNVAVALEHRGADEQALEHYDAALAARPEHAGARLNRGALHLRYANLDKALADFDALVEAEPQSVEALLNRARTYLQLHQDDHALRDARAAARLAPDRHEARKSAAVALASMGYLEAAEAEVRGIDPAWDSVAAYAARALQRQDLCDWRDRDEGIAAVRELLRRPNGGKGFVEESIYMRMLAMPFDSEELRLAANAAAAAIHCVPATEPIASRPPQGRIRVGFVCEGVGRHPETYLLRRVVGDMDRARFEVRLYALNRDDGTGLRRDFASRADAFADLSGMDSPAIVSRLRKEALDIAFDAGGYFLPARPEIFKTRVAPVQAAYLATPGPHGEGLVDYRLSDAQTTPPELQGVWTEKLVLLPAPHWVHDDSNVIAPAGTRAEHGLPAEGFVFCCITQAWKLEPESFSIWMRLLRAIEGSVLWLLDSGAAVNRNLRAAASSRGVAAERLVFAPRVELDAHLGRLQHAGLFLDTFYFNAQTTAIDALWAGVPLVTRTRATMASRLASTFVRSAGLGDLVTDSSEAYEATALRLAREPGRLAHYRNLLVSGRGSAPLFDTGSRVRAVERAIEAMVGRSRAGLPPETLVVP